MFENRYQAINFYKKQLSKVDGDLQDFLVHHEKIRTERVLKATKDMRELMDLIQWNKDELKKETKTIENKS
jgi:hypothetical protein